MCIQVFGVVTQLSSFCHEDIDEIMTPGDTYGRWTQQNVARPLSILTVFNGWPAHFPKVHTPARDT